MKKEKISNIIFITILSVFWIIVLVFLIKNSNEYNLVDNRISYKFEKITLKRIISGEYQDNMEKAISDQLPKYNYFKILYPKISNYINYNSVNLFKLDTNNKYVNLGNIYLYNNYLLYGSITEDDYINFDDDIDKINYIINNSKANIYLYYINSDNNIDFSNNKKIDVEDYLKLKLNIGENNISSLRIDSFNDYKRYFYKLDHHWNNVGTDVAYNDIVNMMNLDNKLNIKDTICFNDKRVLGSKSKLIALDSVFKEKMCVYDYNYPAFLIKVNDKVVADYGNNFDTLSSMEAISYSSIYGSDYAEIVFENKDCNNEKNLLIYSNSYSNSINKLLASHYSNTYVIDGRYNQQFDMMQYINDKNIDDVLILSNKMLFFDDIKWGGF